jgi:hypothetical protein
MTPRPPRPDLSRAKLFIGPMSVNTVDAVIEFANETAIPLGLIPSRRQVDHDGGYTGFNTESFARYVRERSQNVILQRDHGGEGQGDRPDDGVASYNADAKHFDLVHIDPWKTKKDYASGMKATLDTIEMLEGLNPDLGYEVGTEEAIHPSTADELRQLLDDLKRKLPAGAFAKIKFAVIQSGTSLQETHNTGTYDSSRLGQMIKVCKSHDVLSKEHNGDYLETTLIRQKFTQGLDAINIAPEFGKIETETACEMMGKGKDYDTFFNLCLECPRWRKWVGPDFDPNHNRDELIRICGHYVFNDPRYKQLKRNWRGFDEEAKKRIKNRIREIVA